MQQPRPWWALVVILVVLILAIRAIESENNKTPRAEPPKTTEVAEALRDEGPLSKRGVAATGCRQTSLGHWSCVVKFEAGGEATVNAVWDGQRQAISYSLTSERGRTP